MMLSTSKTIPGTNPFAFISKDQKSFHITRSPTSHLKIRIISCLICKELPNILRQQAGIPQLK